MCAADITLEDGRTTKEKGPEGETKSVVRSGYDVPHKCRDSTPVWNYLNEKWLQDFPVHDIMDHAAMYGEA
jgi:hypothetical protein